MGCGQEQVIGGLGGAGMLCKQSAALPTAGQLKCQIITLPSSITKNINLTMCVSSTKDIHCNLRTICMGYLLA